MKKNNSKIYLIYSFLISIFSMSLVKKALVSDTFSTIKIGQYVLKHGIDFTEHFNFNSNLHYHHARWLFTVIISFLYDKMGYFGIYLFVMVFSAVLGLVLFNVLNKMKNNMFLSFVTTILTMVTMNTFISARAQLMSYIFLLLEVFFIEKIIETNKKKYILFTLICSIAIVNLHTSVWPMTLVLFLPYFAEYFISRIKKFNKQKIFYSQDINFKLLLCSFILIFISGLCTPLLFTDYALTPYTYMFKTMSGISSLFIEELQKPTSTSYLLYIIIFLILVLYFKPKIKVSDFFMYGGLLFMSSMAIRNCAFLYLISPIIFLRLFNNIIENKKEEFDRITSIFINDKTIVTITSIFILILSSILIVPNIKSSYVDKREFPIEASDYILKNIDIDNMRLYNGFDYGSYLEFRGMKVFLDSRSEVYCEEYNDTTILKDWYNVYYLSKYYKDIFNKYDFTHALLYKKEKLNNYIKHDKDYRIIYKDESFVLYEKVR